MRLLCLDLSTNSGWALIDDGKLCKFGNIRHKVEGDETHEVYPTNFRDMAEAVARDCMKIALEHKPDLIVIEETNKGKNRYSQKQLEFIHYAVNAELVRVGFIYKIRYLDTSEWRKLLGLHLDKDQRTRNNEVQKQRFDLMKELIRQYDLDHQQESYLIANIKGKRDQKKAQKEFWEKRSEWVKEKLRPFRSKIDGKVAGKIGVKNLSVNYVNEFYHLKFKKKDNDIADAICLGLAYIKKCSNTAPLE